MTGSKIYTKSGWEVAASLLSSSPPDLHTDKDVRQQRTAVAMRERGRGCREPLPANRREPPSSAPPFSPLAAALSRRACTRRAPLHRPLSTTAASLSHRNGCSSPATSPVGYQGGGLERNEKRGKTVNLIDTWALH
ncbi:Os04g0664732 [Oryza sativa Japonica Group]|uniref:Os04g0664732 protein n=1 Tax=Oryza sativa subsp. japonica TaxID=39947 RepID=A0A0P0WGA2_ORYSJ|nr:Os04g0664732 [Oryza sativa Japonica Group]